MSEEPGEETEKKTEVRKESSLADWFYQAGSTIRRFALPGLFGIAGLFALDLCQIETEQTVQALERSSACTKEAAYCSEAYKDDTGRIACMDRVSSREAFYADGLFLSLRKCVQESTEKEKGGDCYRQLGGVLPSKIVEECNSAESASVCRGNTTCEEESTKYCRTQKTIELTPKSHGLYFHRGECGRSGSPSPALLTMRKNE